MSFMDGVPRDPDRIPLILAEIRRIWELDPDLRFGQLVLNLYSTQNMDPFYAEDDKLLDCVKLYGERLRDRIMVYAQANPTTAHDPGKAV